MRTIGALLERDLSQPIEEIIQVDQADEQTVYTELTEYIATDSIRGQYRDLLKAIAEGPAEPREGIGVWISGFFGSGKSSFAKNLGYALENPTVQGRKAADLFKDALSDGEIAGFVDLIDARFPTDAIMFDISKGSEVRRGDEKIAEVVYRAVLKELGYALDYDVAELEIELEQRGELELFEELAPKITNRQWTIARKGARKLNYASAILHRMNPSIFPEADSWAKTVKTGGSSLTVEVIVDRIFDLFAIRRPGQALVFIIDEVGQYVARSAEKIEDLRALVEQIGKVGKNRVQRKEAVAPTWFVVTSQERLDEVVAAIDSKRVELAKLQDRFRHRVDMSPADIREVATRRVLNKKAAALPILKKLFQESQGKLNAALRLERNAVQADIDQEAFVDFYPYPPHFVGLSIDIMSGIRLQPGAPKHLGGSNRTIIKQAYEMLVSPKTRLAEASVGTLVTLDKVFDLVEGNLRTEKRNDIQRITDSFGAASMAVRVAKVLVLLEFVRNLPRTESNIAACLIDTVGQPKPQQDVEGALQALEAQQFVRNTEEGWKLQTDQEKSWDTERRQYLDPRPRDRNEIIREALGNIFSEPQLRAFRYKNIKTFHVGLRVDGVAITKEGQIPLSIVTADDPNALTDKVNEIRTESRSQQNQNEVYWAFAVTPEVDNLVAEVHASRQMVAAYDQLRAQNKISGEEAALLEAEKRRGDQLQRRLRDKMEDALRDGSGAFRGVVKAAADLGDALDAVFKGLFALVVPDLYAKLEMGSRNVKGNEAEELLKAANLNALPQVFYEGTKGLSLVVKESGGKHVLNPSAEIAREVLSYLEAQHSYGNKVTGKYLDQHFQGIGYGWDRDILLLVLAVLLRAGSIEVGYQGRRFRSHADPQARVPLTNTPAFRSASFAPRESIDLKTLIAAVRRYEEITGEEVEVEEGAIANAFKKVADEEIKLLLPVAASVSANALPVGDVLEEYRRVLDDVQTAPSDDCVRILAGEGKSFMELRSRVRRIREAVNNHGADTVQNARRALREMWPALDQRGADEELSEQAEALRSLLKKDTLFEELADLRTYTEAITEAYQERYVALHEQRFDAYEAAIDEVKGRSEWQLIPESMTDDVLAPLQTRLCQKELELTSEDTRCQHCRATLSQMESDLAAVTGLRAQVIARVQELTSAEDDAPIERVRVMTFFTETLDSEESVDASLQRLREHLLKLLDAGARIIIE